MPVNAASPSPNNLQETTIEEEREDPDLSLSVHPAAEQTTDADMQPEANPATTSPVHVTAEKDTDVEITSSQFVKQTGGSSVLAKIVVDAKPASSSKISVPEVSSLENLDFSSLLQEFSRIRLREDKIVAMLKKKYEVNFIVLHI